MPSPGYVNGSEKSGNQSHYNSIKTITRPLFCCTRRSNWMTQELTTYSISLPRSNTAAANDLADVALDKKRAGANMHDRLTLPAESEKNMFIETWKHRLLKYHYCNYRLSSFSLLTSIAVSHNCGWPLSKLLLSTGSIF